MRPPCSDYERLELLYQAVNLLFNALMGTDSYLKPALSGQQRNL